MGDGKDQNEGSGQAPLTPPPVRPCIRRYVVCYNIIDTYLIIYVYLSSDLWGVAQCSTHYSAGK